MTSDTNSISAGEGTFLPESPSFTGIPMVDRKLADVISGGGLVLVSGLTGTGKTVLAGQIAAQFATNHRVVDYVSTSVPLAELEKRILSCATRWPYESLERGLHFEDLGNGYKMPLCTPHSGDFSSRALRSLAPLKRNLHFHCPTDFKENPVDVLNQVIKEIMGRDGTGCLILDQLDFSGVQRMEMGRCIEVNMTETAEEIMTLLGSFAYEFRIPVFVFCVRHPADPRSSATDRKLGRVGGICNFPTIEGIADVTIELTDPVSHPSDRLRGEGQRLCERHFIMSAKDGFKETLVPVVANFEYLRFDPWVKPEIGPEELDKAFRHKVRGNSKRLGYIRFPREQWSKLLDIRHVATRAVYLAMVLNADQKTGKVVCAESLLQKLLGLSRSVVRRALDHLEHEGKFIREHSKLKKGLKESRRWEIVGYARLFQKTDSSDYVVIARNILDENREELRCDVDAFALWLELLFEARFVQDEEGYCDRGCWCPDYHTMAARLRCSEEDVVAAVGKLEEQGRLHRLTANEWGEEILRLPNYDQYQRQVPWQKSRHSTAGENGPLTREDLKTVGPTNLQKRTIDEPLTEHWETIDEPLADHPETIDGPHSNQVNL